MKKTLTREKVELVKQYLKEGWGISYSMSKAKLHVRYLDSIKDPEFIELRSKYRRHKINQRKLVQE